MACFILKVSGSNHIAGTKARVMRMVEIPSCHFKTVWTESTVMVKKWAQRTERKEAKIPTLVTTNGK